MLFAGFLLLPIAFLCPKRADWVAVIGRQDGRFLDNAKYFFIQAPSAAPELRIVFVTERPDVFQFLTGRSRETLLYPTAKSVWFLLRCGTVVVDEAAWFRKARFFLLIRSRVVQLWHGVPFKWIELGLWRNPTGKFSWTSNRWVLWFRHLIYRLTGRYMRYSVVISTSKFYRDNVFSKAFSSHYFLVTGYPRNDFALSLSEEDAKLAWMESTRQLKVCYQTGKSWGEN